MELILVVLVASIAAFFMLSVAFAIMVLVLRAGHTRARRRMDDQEARWRDTLLDVVAGAGVWKLQERVHPGEELDFIAYLLRFSRQLRGEEARRVAAVGAPFVPIAVRGFDSSSPERRAQAIQAIAAFGMPAHATMVLAALDDPSPYVAVSAAQALASRGDAEYAPHVLRRVRRFHDWSAEYLSAMIARFGPAAAEPARALLADANQPVHARAVAAGAISRLNDPLAADTAAGVLDLLSGNPWTAATIQSACLGVLAQVGHASHVEMARRFIASPHPAVRGAAVRALAILGGAKEAPAVAAALRDDSRWVVQEAARALLRLGRLDVLRGIAEGTSASALVARQVLAGAGVAS